MSVYGVAHSHRRESVTPSLMADMYSFVSEEEMQDTKAYLHSHDGYQLEQVNECLYDTRVDECIGFMFSHGK